MNFAGLQAQMEQALEGINKKREQMREVEQELLGKTTTARSKDRMVTATVKAGGELTKLEFHDERYRTMPKAELADAIVKVVAQAREEMQTQVNQVIAPQLGDIKELREMLHGGSSFGDFLQPLLKVQQDITDGIAKKANGNG